METKHTPTPWKVERPAKGIGKWAFAVDTSCGMKIRMLASKVEAFVKDMNEVYGGKA